VLLTLEREAVGAAAVWAVAMLWAAIARAAWRAFIVWAVFIL
jgi:hypothetical protein